MAGRGGGHCAPLVVSGFTRRGSRVGLTEWDSIEQAQAFYKSKAWTDLSPQRGKAVKTIRRYVVEALN